MGLFTTIPPSILPPARQSAGSTGSNTAQVQAVARGTPYEQLAVLLGQSDRTLQNQIDTIMSALRKPLPQPATYYVTNPNGVMIAWLGYRVVNGVTYQALWANQAYFGGTDPTNAPVNINGNAVTLRGVSLIVAGSIATFTVNGSTGVVSFFTSTDSTQIIGGQIVLQDSLSHVLTLNAVNGLGIGGIAAIDSSRIGNLLSLVINGSSAIDSSRNASFLSLTINGTSTIDSSRNGAFVLVNATSGYKYNGTSGVVSNTTYADGNVTTTTLQYKDWAGTNQSFDVVTAIAHRTISVGGGIITAI